MKKNASTESFLNKILYNGNQFSNFFSQIHIHFKFSRGNPLRRAIILIITPDEARFLHPC